MNENKPLPKGWEVKNLGEVCEIFNGSTPLKRKKEYWENGTINWFTISDIRKQGRVIKFTNQRVTKKGFESTSLKILPVNSILLCCTASIGEFAITRIELTTNQQFNGLVVKNHKQLLPEYLFYFSSILKKTLLNVSGRATIDFVSMTKVRNIQILLPPLSEQKRIVAILDKTFAEITKAETIATTNLQNAKELFESYLNNVFENKGDDWEEKTLDNVCLVERGSSPRPIKKYLTDGKDGVNWIKIGDTKNIERYIYKTNQRITKEGAEKSRFVKEGDFILSNSMSFGKPYIMKTTGCIHDGWFKLKLYDFIDTEYFYQLISSPYVNNQFHNLASGSVVKNISSNLVKKVVLPIPALKTQKQIVRKFDQLQTQTKKLEIIYQHKIEDLEELKKSILQKAFNGML